MQSLGSAGDGRVPLSGGGAGTSVPGLMGLWHKSSPSVQETHREKWTCSLMVGAGLGLGQRRGAFPILQTVLSSEGLGLWGGMAPVICLSTPCCSQGAEKVPIRSLAVPAIWENDS